MKTENHPLLLLPQGRNLLVKKIGNQLVVSEFPEWLADYLDVRAADLVNKNVDAKLEKLIPGISELIMRTGIGDTGFTGIKTTIIDYQGKSHQLLLDSFVVNQESGTSLIKVVIQEISTGLPAALENATFCGLVGASAAMQKVFNKIRMYAISEAAVLVTGATGAGKEGVAAAIHQLSNRSRGPFVTMNCSAITDTLFESELFGHEKGSFTGAIKSHRGRFERADGGTLFLDEIGDLPALSQAKLLRALETSQIERVGSEKPININVRIVAATNHNLEKNSQNNTFRADLFYRINALQIRIPPLRERQEDIELLIQHFIKSLNAKYGRNISCLTREALQLLKQYQWPGNVRELRNLMERLFAENQTDVIGLRSLREWYEERMNASKYNENYREVTILPDRQAIPLGMAASNGDKKITADELKQAFRMTSGNITKAAEVLGIHKATFYRTLKALNLEREDLQ